MVIAIGVGTAIAAVNAVSGLLGGLGAGQTLAKLEIIPRSRPNKPPSKLEKITITFNPESYSITKPVTWQTPGNSTAANTETQRFLNAPGLGFSGGGSRILTFQKLFFDVTEPIDGKPYDDVRKLTNKIVALTRIERNTGEPPICELFWGGAPPGSDFPFTGVVTNLVQNFTLFRRDGKPVRADLTLTFTEYIEPLDDQRETDPELTTRVVQRGDTLASIAAELYGDPTRWRIIAAANQLDDPRNLVIGRLLSIPDVE
jgi:Contractile injection system tube protein/LysM domain